MSELDAMKIRYLYDCPDSGKPVVPNPDPDSEEDYDVINILDWLTALFGVKVKNRTTPNSL